MSQVSSAGRVVGNRAGAGGWTPPAGLLQHADVPIPPDAEFFQPPPREIGALQSAQTSLRTSHKSWSLAGRALLTATVTAVVVGLVLWIGSMDDERGRPQPMALVAFLGGTVGLIALSLILYFTRFRHTCNYVGEAGVAAYVLKGNRGNPPKAQVMLFRDAAELRTSETRHYYNGVYTGTTYAKKWTDANGQVKLQLGGQHQGQNKPPKPHSLYHFAQAAEIAWSQFLLGGMADALARDGLLHFNTTKGNWVRVGPGFFEFSLGKQAERIEAADIKSIDLSDGTFRITHKDAKWFSSQGKFSFQYGNMANARLFLLAVEKLIGFQFG